MANLANSTIALTALLGASIASVVSALEKTHALLHGAVTNVGYEVPAGGHFGGLSRRLDCPVDGTFPAPLPPLSVAISRRREVFGSFDGGRDHG